MKSDELQIVPSTFDYLQKVLDSAPKDTLKLSLSHRIAYEAKYVSVTIPEAWADFEVVHLTDVQYGHVTCNMDKFRKFLDWILESDRRFVVFGGDMIDSVTKTSVGGTHDNLWEPSEQILRFVEETARIRHRVLGYVGGNHERRVPGQAMLIASLLRIPYSSGEQVIDIHYGEHRPFKIGLYHGSGSASTKGAISQKIDRWMKKMNCNLYLIGHLHQFQQLVDARIIAHRGKFKLQDIVGMMSTSFQEYWGSYAEVAGLNPNRIRMARAVLEPNGDWYTIQKFRNEAY